MYWQTHTIKVGKTKKIQREYTVSHKGRIIFGMFLKRNYITILSQSDDTYATIPFSDQYSKPNQDSAEEYVHGNNYTHHLRCITPRNATDTNTTS